MSPSPQRRIPLASSPRLNDASVVTIKPEQNRSLIDIRRERKLPCEVGIRWTNFMNFGSLTTLVLHNQVRIKDFDEMVEIFHLLGGLETLALHRCLPAGQNADGKTECLLPWLNKVKLTDDLASINTFMRRVLFLAERLEIDCDVQDVSEALAFGEVYPHRLEFSLRKNAKRFDIMLDVNKPCGMRFHTYATASTPSQCFEIRYKALPPNATAPNVFESLLMAIVPFLESIETLGFNDSTNEGPHEDLWPHIWAQLLAIQREG
ncbi:hypothetical protein EYR40_011026 [Pleurotus pulmonarius]|nr:hypothetical protein EYR36_002794 [Pleurotus pulmonarius]KAF4587007.1 hypothetical protein EYR40_011026 [Pleurotus pulmonarius]